MNAIQSPLSLLLLLLPQLAFTSSCEQVIVSFDMLFTLCLENRFHDDAFAKRGLTDALHRLFGTHCGKLSLIHRVKLRRRVCGRDTIAGYNTT